MELVLHMPDVVSVCPSRDGTVILQAIPDESTKGIASLVAKQRSRHKVQNSSPKGRAGVCSGPRSRPLVPYRGRVPPVLPAVVKSKASENHITPSTASESLLNMVGYICEWEVRKDSSQSGQWAAQAAVGWVSGAMVLSSSYLHFQCSCINNQGTTRCTLRGWDFWNSVELTRGDLES
ncbi:hypothetical protein MC885_019927 [Smutsia gigantea]|nr:hypothetical protein MC885_019927 [Smutsia gigantea]